MENQQLKEKELTLEERQQVIIKEQAQLLKRAKSEIESLQRQNHVLYSKQDVFDKVFKMVTINDRNGYGGCEKANDLSWEIDKYISKLESTTA